MPVINLNIPKNSKFHSSLNEIDLAMQQVLLSCMQKADPRDISKKQSSLAENKKNNWLWDNSRVFQVDDLDTEEVFNTFLLRQKINNKQSIDITYPILAFKQENIETAFWGTGNRYKQWNIEIENNKKEIEKDSTVIIKNPYNYRGKYAKVSEIISVDNVKKYKLIDINSKDDKVISQIVGSRFKPILFTDNDISIAETNISTFKAKPITCKYTSLILCDNKDELQYIRDTLIMNILDANIWWIYDSPTLNGEKNQIYTVFEIPNIERYPLSTDKIKGKGYIYGSEFKINVWACLTNKPLPSSIIESIRMNLKIENVDKEQHIVIT